MFCSLHSHCKPDHYFKYVCMYVTICIWFFESVLCCKNRMISKCGLNDATDPQLIDIICPRLPFTALSLYVHSFDVTFS